MTFELPKTQPKITKEFLLSKNTEETYMSTYLGVPVKKGLQISPLRKDHKPTASFYRNKKNELIFHDFGIGFHGNFLDVVMYINKCTYSQALNIIAEDFKYIEKSSEREPIKIRASNVIIEEKSETLIQIEDQPFQDYELKWWESFGIHESTLKKFKVHSCKSIFLNGNYYRSSSQRSNIFGYYGGKKNGIELWRIYFPQMREYRFLSNWSKDMIQGSKQIPNNPEYLVITKSMKDIMNLYESKIPAIAPCSETVLIEPKQMDRIKKLTSNICYLGDNDLPGVKGAHKYKKQYPFIRCIFIKRKYAKDISDLYKYVGKKDHEEAMEELKEIFNDKEKGKQSTSGSSKSKSSIGKANRRRGHAYERKIVNEMQKISKNEKICTSRSESKSLDDKKIDICDPDNVLPCYIQIKCTQAVPKIKQINEEVGLHDKPLAIIWNAQEARESKQVSVGEYAIIPKNFFYELLKRLY